MHASSIASSLVDFVKAIARCRSSINSTVGEATPPLSTELTLHDLYKARGLEQLYVPFDKINHTHKYKGKLGFCYKTAYRLAESDSIFVYCEGYATSENLSIPLAHAWCVNRETREVYDPVWNTKKTRGNAYCGLPMNLGFVREVILHNKQYGVLDSIWMCKHLFNTPLSDILHPDYKEIIL
jgi:hypothetical protein